MISRTQHDAVAPWGVLSRSHRTRSMGRQLTEAESEAQTENTFSRQAARCTVGGSRFRSDEESRYLDLYRRDIESRPAYDTMNSEVTNATTSTIRRQSVRDLFKDFGVERPAGLTSRETSYDKEEAPRIVRRDTQCHICLKVNSSVSSTCSKCSHKLCSQCQSSHHQETVSTQEQNKRISGLAPKENQSTYRVVNENNLNAAEAQKGVPPTSANVRKPPSKLPGMQPVDLFAILKKTSGALQQDQSTATEPMAIPFRLGSQVPRRVKDSPFLIADLLTTNRSLPSPQVERPSKTFKPPINDVKYSAPNNVEVRKRQNRRLHKLEKSPGISSSSDGNKCSSSTCRATHHGHQPYRHAVSCSKTRRHHHVPKDTDKGYSADTSRFEEATHLHSKSSRIKEHLTTAHSHRVKRNPCHEDHTGITRAPMGDTQASSVHETLEFVECNGYPRTGHAHLGSPVSSGVVGECQHCLHDCHCDACKSTYHSVRCCVHGDHQARTHRHLTPRKEASMISEKESTNNTVQLSNLDDPKTVVVARHSEQKTSKTMKLPSKDPAHEDQPPPKPSPVKMPSLPKTKRSSLLADKFPKPPTPPPWVSSPRKGSIAGTINSERWQEPILEEVQIMSGIKPPDNLPSTSREKPLGPPADPCDEVVNESNLRRSNDALAALRYLYEHDEQRRASLRRPSLRSVIENISRPPSAQPSSRARQVSSSGSRRASRRLSALFQSREQDSVPLLNQKLLECQEELRRTQKEFDDKPKIALKDAQNAFTWNDECKESNRRIVPPSQERKRFEDCTRKFEDSGMAVVGSDANKKEEEAARSELGCRVNSHETEKAESIKKAKPPDTARKKTWRIRLVDRKPSPACVNDEPVEQHRLADDEVVSLGRKSLASLLEQQNEMLPPASEDHECIWKSRLLEQESRKLGIRGVTILVHLEEREDVVFKAFDGKGGELRMEN